MPLAPPQDDALRLRQAFQALVRGFGLLDADRTPCGQPIPISQAHALMLLLRDPGLRQGQLGAALGLTKSGASRLVEQLGARGWVERQLDDGDARARTLRLSASGERVARQVDAASLARFTQVLGRVPEPERTPVLTALGVLARAVSQAQDPATPTDALPHTPTHTPTQTREPTP